MIFGLRDAAAEHDPDARGNAIRGAMQTVRTTPGTIERPTPTKKEDGRFLGNMHWWLRPPPTPG